MTPEDPESAIRARLCSLGADFARHGWLLATGGNLSALLPSGESFSITASGGDKGALGDDDFVEIALEDGAQRAGSGRPSAETSVHLAVYRATSARWVAHVHSPFATLASRRDAEQGYVELAGWELVKALGFWSDGAVVRVPVVPNHADLDRLGRSVGAAASTVPGVLVAGHGLYAWGESCEATKRHVEAIESLCHLSWEWDRRAR